MESNQSANSGIGFSANSTVQTHLVRLNESIEFIEKNLDKDLSLETLAELAHYSPFHFHRTFRTLFGQTPHEFVTRKRIEKIAWVLMKQKNKSIREVVYSYGFESAASFSKSFKKYFGISASDLRKKSISDFNIILRKNSKIGKESVSVEKYFSNTERVRNWMKENAKVEAQHLPSRSLVSIRCQGSFDLADEAFRQLSSWAEDRELLRKKHKWLLIIHDNPAITEVSKMSHSACLEIEGAKEWKDEMGTLVIPSGRFLTGNFEVMDHEFQLAWGGMSIWLLEHGYTYRDGDYFEVFHSDSVLKQGARHRVTIHIPIE